MKLFMTAVAALALSSAAHATPAVGDDVTFQGTWGEEFLEQRLAFTAFNDSTKQFTKLTITTVGTDAPASQEDLIDYDSTASDAALQDVVTNCVNYNGVPETITVPAGQFPTCKLAMQSGGFVYIAVVPFAVARMDTIVDNKPLVLDLISATRGI